MAKESTIRLITRIADEHKAINLGQGFTDEPAVYEMVWGAISASLGGTEEGINSLDNITLEEVRQRVQMPPVDFMKMRLKDALEAIQGKTDVYNQYSYPFGLPELRKSVASYTERFLGFRPDPDKELTIVAGATEGLFVALKALCKPGDEVVIVQPYHEMYLSQSVTLDIKPRFVTLRGNPDTGTWDLDRDEIEQAVTDNTKAFVLNTPHNPTGKVFTREEMDFIGAVCNKHGAFVITDEIYEHILLTSKKHICMATLPGMKEHTFVVNAISKTAKATGWRVGWVISPQQFTPTIRAIHDTIVLQSPSPLQKGAIRLLELDDDFYKDVRKGYIEKRDLLTNALQKTGFRIIPPEGAYYLFADYSNVSAIRRLTPMDAAMYLIKEIGVASIPGDNFYAIGNFGDRYLRFAFCRSMRTIEDGARRLQKLGKI